MHVILAAIVGLVSSYTVGRALRRPGYGELGDIAIGVVGGVAGWRIAAYLIPWIAKHFPISNSSAFLYFSFGPLIIGMILAAVLTLLTHILA